MKIVQFSIDCAEWTRYYYEIEVEDDLSPAEIKDAAYDAIMEGTAKECGTKCLGNVEYADQQYNWPEELK